MSERKAVQRGATVKKYCENAACQNGEYGKPARMLVRQADIDRGWGKYCSKSCAAQVRQAAPAISPPTPVAARVPVELPAFDAEKEREAFIRSQGSEPGDYEASISWHGALRGWLARARMAARKP